MKPHTVRRLIFAAVALPLLGVLSACSGVDGDTVAPTNTGAPAGTATYAPPTATATYTIPGAPAGWPVYHSNGFAIAYPPDWSFRVQGSSLQSQGISLNNGQITISQVTGYSATELQASCALESGESWTTLAGLTMKYSNPEGVHRVWFFLNSANQGYEMDANDGFPTSTPQQVQQDNAILATLRLDNTTPGCSTWGQ